MAKMARSMTPPAPVEIDVVRNGSARLLCHWDVQEIEVSTDGETHIEYEYEEKVIWWAIPSQIYLERQGGRQILTDEGRLYLDTMEDEILSWAMAAGV